MLVKMNEQSTTHMQQGMGQHGAGKSEVRSRKSEDYFRNQFVSDKFEEHSSDFRLRTSDSGKKHPRKRS
jgi:hypothetical protein